MQSESIVFTFKLGLINIYNPVPVQLTLNDVVINELELTGNSNSINYTVSLEDNKKYCLGFKVLSINKPSRINLNNLNLKWVDDNRQFTPGWRASSLNEVWNYTDPDATKKQEQLVQRTQNIDLDYFMGPVPGYLKKFGTFEFVSGETIKFSNLERPYTITTPGTFKLNFTSPISYWLYQNLI